MKSIELSRGHFAIVDDEDYDVLSKITWYSQKLKNGIFYAARKIIVGERERMVYMHRFIMNTPDGMETDHRNGDGLDNRKDNLRNCTHQQNGMNRTKQSNNHSGFKGVCWDGYHQKWLAQIQTNGKRKRIGTFNDKKEAARAYEAEAKRLHGEFARVN